MAASSVSGLIERVATPSMTNDSGADMINWFKGLSQGRRFVVVWNVVLLPVIIPVLIYALFFSGEELPLNPFVMLGVMIVFGVVGGIVAWRQFK